MEPIICEFCLRYGKETPMQVTAEVVLGLPTRLLLYCPLHPSNTEEVVKVNP